MNVEDLLVSKKIDFRTSGKDFLIKCLNPEHDDSNPSMRVDQVMGIFQCMSCGFKGNLFYLMGETPDRVQTAREKIRRKIEDVRAESIGLRMPNDAQYIDEDFRVSAEVLKEFRAFRSLQPDFAERVVFPIYDIKNKITCFVGRLEIDYDRGKPKYKVSPSGSKVPLFPMRKLQPEKGRVMLVEGLFDMLNLYQHGFRNVLCSFGTSTVTKDKLQLLKIAGVTGLDICFDPDEAGQSAAESVRELAEKLEFRVKNINLRDTDPGGLPAIRARKLKEALYG